MLIDLLFLSKKNIYIKKSLAQKIFYFEICKTYYIKNEKQTIFHLLFFFFIHQILINEIQVKIFFKLIHEKYMIPYILYNI